MIWPVKFRIGVFGTMSGLQHPIQLAVFASRIPDPEATEIDEFTID